MQLAFFGSGKSGEFVETWDLSAGHPAEKYIKGVYGCRGLLYVRLRERINRSPAFGFS
jgi:hypothetical protein